MSRVWLPSPCLTNTLWPLSPLMGGRIESIWPPRLDHCHAQWVASLGPRPWGLVLPSLQRCLGSRSIRSTVLSLLPHLLLQATEILQPLICLSSVSKPWIRRESLDTQMVTLNWEERGCWTWSPHSYPFCSSFSSYSQIQIHGCWIPLGKKWAVEMHPQKQHTGKNPQWDFMKPELLWFSRHQNNQTKRTFI